MPGTALHELDAIELTDLVARRAVSAVEVVDAHLGRIESVNPAVNAMVTLVPDHARNQAKAVDTALARGEAAGPLAGLPVAHKDLLATAGIRTTFGSRLFADNVPTTNALIVDRMAAAGALSIGKSNVPEWGAGSQTFNTVFGATRNPYNLSTTCGGSSGGAAVALATRMVPLADGSDMGGSLRNPANFCNVVGFRPSHGRVPTVPAEMAWFGVSTLGPMGRTVRDTALLLSVLAGPDPRSPIALGDPGSRFREPLERDFSGTRIALSPDMGGLPVAPEVRNVIASSAAVFDSLGCTIDSTCPDFTPADFVFKTLRAWAFAAAHHERIAARPDLYKETIHWNVAEGLKLSGMDVARAEQVRTTLFRDVGTFMDTHEFLVLPVSQVAPFDIDTEYPEVIDGTPMATYIDWMKSCYLVSAIGLPAISVPCGFTEGGLPVGVQIVGRFGRDFDVLQLAAAFEDATRTVDRLPPT